MAETQALDTRVTRMEERVDSELRHMATREDLKDLENRLVRLLIVFSVAIIGATSAIIGTTAAVVTLAT